MSARPCRQTGAGDRNGIPRPASRWRRGVSIGGWILPSTTLILLPKCPVCVAMYVALFTGVGISVTTASTVRTALMALCVAILAGLALKTAGRLVAKHRQAGPPLG